MSNLWVRLALIVGGGAIIWAIVHRVMRALRLYLVERSQDDEHDKRIETVMRAAKSIAGIVLVASVLGMVLSTLGISTAPLLGTAGVVGVAVGLASQGVARDVIRGFTLLLDNQVRVGDEVELAGHKGVIEELSLRTVRLRDWEGAVHFVQTREVGTVINRSVGYSYAALDIEISDGADVGAARGAIEQAAADVTADPVSAAFVLGAVEMAALDRWADDALVIKVRMKVRAGAQAHVRRALLGRVRERFGAAGVAAPTKRLAVRLDGPR